MSRRRIRLVVEFDGTNFHGWQRQAGLRTVQGELEATLEFVLQHPVHLVGAGRTDAGCHALAHVASFGTPRPLPARNLLAATNSLSASDLYVHALEEASPSFHARWSARWRDYTYVLARHPGSLLRHRAWHPGAWPRLEPMIAATRLLAGSRDMSGLANASPDNRQPICRIFRVGWEEWSGGLLLRVRADHFLYRMVRTIVGTCVEIGRGRWGVERMEEILASGDRRMAGPPAPAGGLYFTGVGYAPLWKPAAVPPATPWWGASRPIAIFSDEDGDDPGLTAAAGGSELSSREEPA